MTAMWKFGISEIADAFASGVADPVDVTQACLERIAAVDRTIGAFSYLDSEGALAQARARAAELGRGFNRGPLHGVPVGIKELYDIAGAPATYGSLARGSTEALAAADAEVVSRLRDAGAVIIGATRSHEFGWGITTQHAQRGSTRNPWRTDRVPGGSSGGSAAAVAAGMVPIAVASDTGGSIRIPSALCGVVGVKPTFGRIPRTGGIALAPSFDTPGVIARSVADLGTVLRAVAGPDPRDPSTVVRGLAPLVPAVAAGLGELQLGFLQPPFDFDSQDDRADLYQRALDRLVQAGARMLPVQLPPAREFRAAFSTMQMAEAFHLHARELKLFPAHSAEYGADVRERLAQAAGVGIGDYLAAASEGQRLVAELLHALQGVDALLSPISMVSPPTVADPDATWANGVRYEFRDAVMGFTVQHNLAGVPAVAVRAGFGADGLPFGLQVCTAPGEDERALAVATLLDDQLAGPMRFPQVAEAL